MIPGPITINYSHPNITFSVETTGGQVLATNNTGVIPAYPNGGKWVQYGLFFNLPANISDVVVVMTNNAPGGNGNDFVMDDVTFQACGPIIEEGFSATSGPATKGICQGSNEVFTLKGGVIGNGTPSYQWQWNYHNVGWSDISGKNADSLNIGFVDADTGTYQYRLGVANGSGITVAQCRVYSPPLTVIVSALPVVPPIASQTICEGEPFRLNAFGGSSYTWTGPGISATSQNPLIINSATTANSGTFSVVAVSDSGCAAQPVLALVNVLPKIAPVVSQDVAFCAGESTRLTASGGLYYKWSPSTGLDNDTLASPMATPLQTTTYTVAISNGVCSDSSHSVTVTVNQNPVASAGSEIILIEGQSAQLHGTIAGDNITGFSWSPTTFLTDTASQTPVTTPTSDITYTLTAVSQSCGTSTSTVFVRVYKKITVPNTFSPNNDGINDVWNIDALVTYPESVIQVFDRYGQQVFRSTGYSKPWDGKYNGSVLPAGTYYYIIDLKNNTPKISGWVLIVK